MPHRRPFLALAISAALVLGLGAACTDDGGDVRSSGGGSGSGSGSASGAASGSTSGSGSGSGTEAECTPVGEDLEADTEVDVTLDEFSIVADPDEAPAGVVRFVTKNDGEEPHELVVVRAEEADLEIVGGQMDEEALPNGAFIGEIEPFAGGTSCNGAFELAAGDYTLFCNIVETEEDGTVESHVEEGMITGFTVTG
ncbi:MAG TPA: hypothetical protein PKA98_10025 [Acidimicrobiales bacterium]|nr:hypothetical protein [Acidimicrobiales bacterium]